MAPIYITLLINLKMTLKVPGILKSVSFTDVSHLPVISSLVQFELKNLWRRILLRAAASRFIRPPAAHSFLISNKADGVSEVWRSEKNAICRFATFIAEGRRPIPETVGINGDGGVFIFWKCVWKHLNRSVWAGAVTQWGGPASQTSAHSSTLFALLGWIIHDSKIWLSRRSEPQRLSDFSSLSDVDRVYDMIIGC